MNQAKIAVMGFPVLVKWYITSKCNIRCTHCYLTEYNKVGEIGKILEIVDYFGTRKVHAVALLGGEPLTRGDLEEIVSRLVENKISTKIATNAILASKERALSLVQAGASRFQVSLESHLPDVNDDIRGVGTYSKICEGIENLRAADASVSLAITVTKKNYKSLDEFFRFANEINASGLKLNAFVPVGTGAALLSRDYLLTNEIATEVANKVLALQQKYSKLKVDAGAFVKTVQLKMVDKSPRYTYGCGAGTNMIVINSDFTIAACDLLNESDRTNKAINIPSDIDRIWKENTLFGKWRGQTEESYLPVIASFAGVHQHGCHVAYSAYKKNVFE